MKRFGYILMMLALLALLLPAAAFSAEVAQGICKEYSEANHKLVIEEYDTNFSPENKYGVPTGIITEFELSTAKVGLTPVEGDILRVAYVLSGNTKSAVKVMNVSKQNLMKK